MPISTILGTLFRYLLSAMFVVAFIGCATKPVYIAPTDPYDEGNLTYLSIKPEIDKYIAKSIDTETWHELNEAESTRQSEIMQKLAGLLADNHIPSMFDTGCLLIANYAGYFGSGGQNGKFSQQYHKKSTAAGITLQQLERKLDRYFSVGMSYIRTAARTGYQPATTLLSRAGEEIPKKDLSTPAEKLSLDTYNDQMERYHRVNQMWSNAFAAGLMGAAAGMNAYASSKNTQSYSNTNSLNTFAAGSRNSYNGADGNRYTVSKDFFGNSKVRGNDIYNGSTWDQTIETDGDMTGHDSKGNYWTYDENSGRYYNYGTGEMCFGKGSLRTCY